jgi:DnaJ-class molecular chaperone
MTINKNYYNILNINKNASQSEIKKKFRLLSLEYHPDRNNNDYEKNKLFKEINEAYIVLSNENSKLEFDKSLNNYSNNNDNDNNDNNDNNVNNDNNKLIINDLLKDSALIEILNKNNNLFNINNQNIPLISQIVNITIEQSYTGITLPILINKWRIENNHKIIFKETIYLDLYKGIDDGEIVILKNKGNILSYNNIGDVEIIVSIENNSNFIRKGIDLFYKKKITFKESFCGFEFELNHLNRYNYKIINKKGNIIKPNFSKCIEKLGMIRNDLLGNLYIIFEIDYLSSVNELQLKFIEENF